MQSTARHTWGGQARHTWGGQAYHSQLTQPEPALLCFILPLACPLSPSLQLIPGQQVGVAVVSAEDELALAWGAPPLLQPASTSLAVDRLLLQHTR